MEQKKEVKGARRKYTREFIIDAVKLSCEPGKTVAETAKSLGIHENLLYKWRRLYADDPENSFPGKGHLKPKDEEILRLRKELERTTRERDILKKAVAIFSKTPL
jgi:transposase